MSYVVHPVSPPLAPAHPWWREPRVARSLGVTATPWRACALVALGFVMVVFALGSGCDSDVADRLGEPFRVGSLLLGVGLVGASATLTAALGSRDATRDTEWLRTLPFPFAHQAYVRVLGSEQHASGTSLTVRLVLAPARGPDVRSLRDEIARRHFCGMRVVQRGTLDVTSEAIDVRNGNHGLHRWFRELVSNVIAPLQNDYGIVGVELVTGSEAGRTVIDAEIRHLRFERAQPWLVPAMVALGLVALAILLLAPLQVFVTCVRTAPKASLCIAERRTLLGDREASELPSGRLERASIALERVARSGANPARYDAKLVLSTRGAPIVIDDPGILFDRRFEWAEVDRLDAFLHEGRLTSATVRGGGFVGLTLLLLILSASTAVGLFAVGYSRWMVSVDGGDLVIRTRAPRREPVRAPLDGYRKTTFDSRTGSLHLEFASGEIVTTPPLPVHAERLGECSADVHAFLDQAARTRA